MHHRANGELVPVGEHVLDRHPQASRLGMSKAALYYHFRSKTEILQALLEEPVAAYSQLAASAAAGQLSAGQLLRAVIDTTADLHALVDVIGSDPSARSALQDLLPRSRKVNEAITAALAGPRPDPASIIRAHAAYAAAKNGTLALLTARGAHLTRQERAGLLAAAERALTSGLPAATRDPEQDDHVPHETPGTPDQLP